MNGRLGRFGQNAVRSAARAAGIQRRNLMNLGLLTGCALLGSLAAALWIGMVF